MEIEIKITITLSMRHPHDQSPTHYYIKAFGDFIAVREKHLVFFGKKEGYAGEPPEEPKLHKIPIDEIAWFYVS